MRWPSASPEANGLEATAVVTGALRSAKGQTRPALHASCGSSASWYSIASSVAVLVLELDEDVAVVEVVVVDVVVVLVEELDVSGGMSTIETGTTVHQ